MNVIFGDAAKIELAETFEWYEVQQKGLGRDLRSLSISRRKESQYSRKSVLKL